jgi:hypothetical protein
MKIEFSNFDDKIPPLDLSMFDGVDSSKIVYPGKYSLNESIDFLNKIIEDIDEEIKNEENKNGNRA